VTPNSERIEQLIRDAKDPLLQASLLIMSSLDHAVAGTVDLLREMSEENKEHRRDFIMHVQRFDQHIIDEEKILSSVKGAMTGIRMVGWVATGLAASIFVLVGVIVTFYSNRFEQEASALRVVQATQLVVLQRLVELERRQLEDDRLLRGGSKP
jgi:hypothetical protein